MNILVTGASRGIGYELVKTFASRGNCRIIALSRNDDRLKALAEYCSVNFPSSQVIPFPFDLYQKKLIVSSLYEHVSRHFDQLDILVNNAGFLVNKPFTETDLPDIQQMIDINFLAPALIVRVLKPILGRQAKSHIVNISSMGGVQGSVKFAGLSYYSATKSALATLTECLAEEFKSENIAVNCVALGAVQTEMLEKAFPGYIASITAEELSESLADFCIRGMDYCNGKILPFSLSTP